MLKKITGTEIHFKTTITAIKEIVDDLIESIPKPTSDTEDFETTDDPKALPKEKEEVVTEETLTKTDNLDYDDNDQGLVDCLNDMNVSGSSPRIPRRKKRAALPPCEESSESEEESDDDSIAPPPTNLENLHDQRPSISRCQRHPKYHLLQLQML